MVPPPFPNGLRKFGAAGRRGSSDHLHPAYLSTAVSLPLLVRFLYGLRVPVRDTPHPVHVTAMSRHADTRQHQMAVLKPGERRINHLALDTTRWKSVKRLRFPLVAGPTCSRRVLIISGCRWAPEKHGDLVATLVATPSVYHCLRAS